ncbi:MAG: GtrA family protein [Eubacterium sp.]|nr:GtrA family protein [Eubacterium sp.]
MDKIKELYLKYKEIINYFIVGVLTTLVNFVVYYGCVFTILDPNDGFQLQVAIVLAWIAAVAFAYYANRKYVFESKNPDIIKEGAAFFAARIGTLLLEAGMMALFVTLLGFNDKVMKLIVQVLVMIANYVFSKFFVFTKKKTEVIETEVTE